MAQLILTGVAAVGRAGLGAGLGSIVARTAAGAAASFATSAVTNAIFGPRRRSVEGPRLESFSVQASTEGASIPRAYGRARLSGQIIWAARFRETISDTTETSGGKGGPATRTDVRQYNYALSFAVGLCAGPIDRVARVWADGRPLDLSQLNARIYRGSEDQLPDPLIDAVEGVAPAYRGLAYIVFEDLPLGEFGNRIPQLSFEIERSLGNDDPSALENALTAVTMIPGTGEFVYGTTPVTRSVNEGVVVSENAHASAGVTDFTVSLDSLTAAAPNARAAAIVVSWFGDSTDAGACRLRPGVETREKETAPYAWSVGGVGRPDGPNGAHLVSTINGAPAYGGTPSDRATIEAIRAMNDRGLAVMIHPFILMDTPEYPWRGRIASAADGTALAAADIDAFFGAARPDDFHAAGDTVTYAGPPEWSFRRFILHHAWLAKIAMTPDPAGAGGPPGVDSGVEAFILGSELRGLSTTRTDQPGDYPFVTQMIALAADVRAILGPDVRISYGADWSEWFGDQRNGDVFFHLDDLWADENIDFIGVDNYTPLADWRDGVDHLDAAHADSPHDIAYLKSNIEGGERYDWFYATAADRDQQIRTPITDGAYNEPWVYRAKDFANWWSNPHYNRLNGVRASNPTRWVPQSKPFRFTEIGCPAVDKGANAPNVFVDPKSTESALPPYSSGARDDMMQRRVLEAQFAYWRDPAHNPVSGVDGRAMIDADKFYVYAFDARPFPFFPARDDVWGDAANWARGHWLNGRLGRAPLDRLVTMLATEGDLDPKYVDATRLRGAVAGYVVDRPLSPRQMIDPLADVFQIDMVESGRHLRFQPRNAPTVADLSEADLAVDADGPAFSVTLTQAGDAPSAVRIGFIDEGSDYAPAIAAARFAPDIADIREIGLELPVVMNPAEADARARALLADAHVQREQARFMVPPSRLALEPGDGVSVTLDGVRRRLRLTEISDGAERQIEAVRFSPTAHDSPPGDTVFAMAPAPVMFAPPIWEVVDAPLLREGDDPSSVLFAAFSDPWSGGAALYRDGLNPTPSGIAEARAVMGRLDAPMAPMGDDFRSGVWRDETIRLRLPVQGGANLVSRGDAEIYDGANALFIESNAGRWEVVQFRTADLGADGVWSLRGLLRGQAGTERAARDGAALSARVVVATPALAPIALGADRAGQEIAWRAGPAALAPNADANGVSAFTGRTVPYTARGLRPLSPVHLRAQRPPGHDAMEWRLSWIRRTRIGGDNWQNEDAPLGEAFERYRVEILRDGAVIDTVETSAAAYDWTDTGASGSGTSGSGDGALSFRVAQLSDMVGVGDWSIPAPIG